jgi:anti-sigma B factor antagonist
VELALTLCEMANLDSGDQASVTIKTWVEDGTTVVSLSGELDLTNAERVRSVIGDALSRETERLVFEMSGVEFMDSSGIALLASAVRKVKEVELRNPTLIVRRLVELTGLAEILRITP